MKKLFAFFLLVLLGAGASAAPTGIAQLPLLNITGSGNVKPNLMLLYDNSNSMAYTYTPDYVNDTCRNDVTLKAGRTACSQGHPPFNSPDFNRQYYNPKVRYLPPVDALGNSYNSMTRSRTSDWTSVPTDGFGINNTNMSGNAQTRSNLASGYPDMAWCKPNSTNCVYGTGAAYNYPNGTYKSSNYTYATAPFYYTINVAEYCKDAALTVCKTVTIGAPAPAGYPYPAKVRFCTTTDLNTCQAKYTSGGYIYPRFSTTGSTVTGAYGTVTIGASSTTNDLVMNSISVTESGRAVVVTDGAVTAVGGTTTLSRQAALANALAASIVAKTGLTRQYTACVRTPPANSSVPDCASFGINLAGNNTLAVVPITCPAGAAKDDPDCAVLADGSRDGWAVTASAQSRTVNGRTDVIPATTTAIGTGASVFVRTDIVPENNSYPKDAARTDCAGTTCTYDEEMTNFANWYTYYKSRNQMMKTAVGLAFQSINDKYNVGIVPLSSAATETSRDFVYPAEFSGDNRSAWYGALYGMTLSGSTPLRPALNAIGKMYANLGNFRRAVGSEVIKFPCQQNFAFITTDGYWNGGPASNVASNDESENLTRFCSQRLGCVDTRRQSAGTLADVALHWYNGGSSTGTVSLRPDIDPMTKDGVVPAATAGDNQHLHMNTYALGLGVDGVMTFDPKYDTGATEGSDFYKLVTGVSTGCPWNGGRAWVWPDPNVGLVSDSAALQERVDDLWHTAINGRGKYFSASDPNEVVDGLSKALSNIEVHVGAAAASATSTPNITLEDNDIFSATFTTVKWFGVLTDRKLDPVSGEVIKSITWHSSNTLGTKVAATTDSRRIKMLDVDRGGLKEFDYANLNDTEKTWFDNKCGALAQCSNLSPADRLIVNDGSNIVGWLRGRQQYADDTRLRAYSLSNTKDEGVTQVLPIVLGDIAASKPAYQRDPRKNYTAAGYAEFKVAKAGRTPAVFVAANDGMLHAFDAGNGNELWAYMPRITMKKLHLQASTTYSTNHQFSTDGSPEISDVKIGTNWRSVLVAGLNAGGRGYYALDVTDPANPVALWELCADSTICSGNNYDADLGLSFGNPQFGTWKDASGAERWVVFLTSGYNNVPGGGFGGDGKGYLYVVDVATGRVLSKKSTNVGDTTTPSGLAKITAITDNPLTDPLVTYVYAGDNQGKMWRFDYTAGGDPTVVQMGDAGTAQPVTSRPEVTMCQVENTDTAGVRTVSAQKVVIFGTGRLLDLPDIADTNTQSVYVLKDSNTGIPAASWRNPSSMVEKTLAHPANTQVYTISGAGVNLGTQAGWFFDLDQNAGERVNLDPKVAAGTLTVVSNIPSSSSSCKVGGSSNVYQLNVCTAAPVNSQQGIGAIAGSTLSANSAAVGFIIVRLPSGALKMVTTTADGNTITSSVARATDVEAHRAGWRRVRE
ncbi:pilus assembly protein [Massilia norwichensis]|uniref:PilC/PilY family type IV pilus protein n=1 Tax=Massilia norwichensis TaxID=1442366 RepID=A0ABT2A9T8_9BURK|nr:PilC/PilY family type IV pilus protein [Massilia norwichensis]MCS0590963.1 PilC/PilY family type IV pilus protein [Massilia norwichensis]